MFLHVLADTLGSIGVITSSILIQLYDWKWADSACSLFIASMIFISVWPLLKSSGMILLQRVPQGFEYKAPEFYRQVSSIDGVIGYHQGHFWELSSGMFVGSIVVRVSEYAAEQKIRKLVLQAMSDMGITSPIVQIDKPEPIHHE